MQSQSTKSHEIQTIIATRTASQTDPKREEWVEWKRYQSASHSFSVTAKQCRSDAVQKLFAKERKHNLIYVCAFFSVFHNGSPSEKNYLIRRKNILIKEKTKACTFSLFRPERLNMPTWVIKSDSLLSQVCCPLLLLTCSDCFTPYIALVSELHGGKTSLILRHTPPMGDHEGQRASVISRRESVCIEDYDEILWHSECAVWFI